MDRIWSVSRILLDKIRSELSQSFCLNDPRTRNKCLGPVLNGKKSTTSGNMSETPSPEWAELTALEHSRINPYQTWCHDICFGAGV